ncbi:hypothetical protein GCM10010232_71060 [Streptomyces amakusaensis]|uniref:Uncharacterized protein n=1 Tax=Streptomyces amakusaensis TaxID=67271 RepID=A0ABW0AW54_9ACTN
METGLVAVAAEVWTSLLADSAPFRHELSGLGGSGRAGAAPVPAVAARAELQAVEGALLEFRTSPLGCTEEAETETHRAYRTGEDNRCWCKHNPNSTDAITAASKAPDTARERTARSVQASADATAISTDTVLPEPGGT